MSRILDARILVCRETGLASPSGILYDGQNRNLWIVDMGNRRLVCFDQIRHGFQSFDTSPVFRRPLAITRLDGRLVVSDALDNTIWIRQTDKTWDSLVSPDELTPPLDFPGSVAADQWGNLYFTDFHHDRICRRNREGRLTVLDGIPCRQPYGIAVWDSLLFVTDTACGRILCYSLKDGRCTALAGETPAGFLPIAVAADEMGDLYISTVRAIYLYQRGQGRLERLLDSSLWKNLRGTKLGHIGALAALPDGALVFSDTLRNELYYLRISKSDG